MIGLSAASSPRSWPSSDIATAQPPCTGPTTLPAGMRAPVKNTSLNSLPPVSIRMGRTSTPGVSIGHNRNVMPRCLATVGSVRASTKIQLALVANDVQIFCPSITHSSPSSTARVVSPARSEPAFGSENPWHHESSPERIRGRNARFCSSVPHFNSVLPTIFTVTVSLAGPSGTIARAHSSTSTTCSSLLMPPPPYSTGQASPRRPSANSVARHDVTNSAASSAGSAPIPGQSAGRWSARNARTRTRNTSASGEGRRSTAVR